MTKKNPTLWLIIISFLLILFDYSGWLDSFKIPVEKVIIPTKQTVFRAKTALQNFTDILIKYPQLKKLTDDNSRIVKQNRELATEVKICNEENSKLRYQLGAPLPASYQFIPAQVVTVGRFMEIAAGSKAGVKPDMVVVDGKTFIGKVASVSYGRSNVLLPLNTELSLPVTTSRDAKGIVTGQGGGKILLDKVLQKDPLFLGDEVFTSGEGGYPTDLIVGVISHINADDVSTYKQASLEPALDYNKEKMVFVISSL
ncbi:rod shape-determining protein MreC [Candidatus Gottesmanbacteria bacterium]|nr:rod shape-determining protein MreC [Candidatus Gottesmanbacteria bacterium]